MLIDTHCHLYLQEFKNDITNVIQRALDKNVRLFYLPGIDSEVIDDMLLLEKQFPKYCRLMMGLHPCSLKKETYHKELNIVKDWIDKRNFYAIGEIGLDFYWDTSTQQEQYEAFEIQMEWALEKNLPIVIHSRNATEETIATVKPFAAKGLKGIFHCFGGTLQQAEQIIEMNFMLGIGGVLTYKKAGLDEVLQHIDLKHIVLETDAPYLTPVPHRGKRNESAYLELIAAKLAAIKQVSMEEITMITTKNAEKVFGR